MNGLIENWLQMLCQFIPLLHSFRSAGVHLSTPLKVRVRASTGGHVGRTFPSLWRENQKLRTQVLAERGHHRQRYQNFRAKERRENQRARRPSGLRNSGKGVKKHIANSQASCW